VVGISHDMRFVAESFDRIVVMRAGRIVLDGTPQAVFAESAWPTLASTFLDPPFAARVGARLGLGATPTEATLVAALAPIGLASPRT
jgi:energy-coupling factor transport system ATP-binding protein